MFENFHNKLWQKLKDDCTLEFASSERCGRQSQYLQESTWRQPRIHCGIVNKKHLGKSLVKHVCCPVGKSMYRS